MNKKLTLKLDEKAIMQARTYAQKHHVSLSKMVESFFKRLDQGGKEAYSPTPLVKELSGVVSMPKAKDYKQEYIDYLEDKYQ